MEPQTMDPTDPSRAYAHSGAFILTSLQNDLACSMKGTFSILCVELTSKNVLKLEVEKSESLLE